MEAQLWRASVRHVLSSWVGDVKSPLVLAQVALLTGYVAQYGGSPLPPALRKKAEEALDDIKAGLK